MWYSFEELKKHYKGFSLVIETGSFRAKYSQKAVSAKRNGKKPKQIACPSSNPDNDNGDDEEEIDQDQDNLEEVPDTPSTLSQPPRPNGTPPPPLSTP